MSTTDQKCMRPHARVVWKRDSLTLVYATKKVYAQGMYVYGCVGTVDLSHRIWGVYIGHFLSGIAAISGCSHLRTYALCQITL